MKKPYKCFYNSTLNWKTVVLTLLVSLKALSSQGQITVKFKPDSLVGKDAMLQTSYGCRMSSYGANPDTLNFGKSIENLIMDWNCTIEKINPSQWFITRAY
jgi:hypothetical protein